MIFSNEESYKIYEKLYNWLAGHSTGSNPTKTYFKNYQKWIWDSVLNKIKLLKQKSNLTKAEKEFLNLTLYKGDIFRFQNYRPNLKGYVYPMPFYQSWSKDIDGLLKVNGFYGKLLLIKGNTDLGIDIFGLLTFLLKQKYITSFSPHNHPTNLLRYEEENEIVFPIQINNIKEIYIVKKETIHQDIKSNNCLPREKWIRNKLT